MSLLSALHPTSASIQKEYVKKRQRHLYKNDDAKTAAVKQVVEALMCKHGIIPQNEDDWHNHYLKIHRGLQASSLTINFDAGSWFSKDNQYPTYAQMYQRAVGADGKMVLKDTDPLNPARARAVADDLVTLPDEWANAHPFSQRRRLYDALSVTGAELSAMNTKKMAINDPGNAPKLKSKDGGYATKNHSFKPKAKQVFAALNYGMRPHGSTTGYGYSHLVLEPKLKIDALYYPADTFHIAGGGTTTQATCYTIGALLQFASSALREMLWTSCHDCKPLADTDDGGYLIEAHIFKTVKVNRDVEKLVLSRQRKDSSKAPWTNQEWDTIVTNATNWCTRNNVRLTFACP